MAATFKLVIYLIRRTVEKFSADGCARTGAALAYYSFFSLFPLLLLLISSLGYLLAGGVPLLVDARSYVLESVANVLPQAQDLLERSIDAAQAARGTTGFIGLLALLWSASNVFTQLYQALNVIWDCCPAGGLGANIRTKLTAITVVLSISFLLLVAMVADTTLVVAARQLALPPEWRALWIRLGTLSPPFMAAAVFAVLYRYLPNTKVRWREVWPGALLAGVAWELLRRGFIVYTTSYANYVAVYGAVASTIALLTWIYLSAQILLFGAEFSVVYARSRGWSRVEVEAAWWAGMPDRKAAREALVTAQHTVAAAWGALRRRGDGRRPGPEQAPGGSNAKPPPELGDGQR